MANQLVLKPLDTFFFRDGKPFSRGEQTEATAFFPPFPSTVYGALRGLYISENGWEAFEAGEFENIIGMPTSDTLSSFRVKGVFLEDEEQEQNIYAPLPRDLVADKKELKKAEKSDSADPTPCTAYPLSLVSNRMLSNTPTPEMLMNLQNPGITVEYPSQGAFITHEHLKRYLCGEQNGIELYLSENFFKREPKVGIARDAKTRTTEEARLYKLPMLRFKQYSRDVSGKKRTKSYHFRVDMTGITFTRSQGLLKLGGEQKAFEYQVSAPRAIVDYSETERQTILQAITQTKRFKLYFATPVIWETTLPSINESLGWKAPWMDGNIPFSAADGTIITCKLLTAAVGNYRMVGGWDITKRRPKTMWRAVPAGSVYYFELLNGKPEDILNVFHAQNISQYRSKEGFGLTYVGAISGGEL